MRRPFLHYCYVLAERCGELDINKILALPNDRIVEWMAFDLTKSEEFQDKLKKEQELEATRQMSGTELAALFRSMGGQHKHGNDS